MIQTNKFFIDGPIHIIPKKFEDNRGFFKETYRKDWFKENIANVDFVQENQSFSISKGTIRGLHMQIGEKAQGKLVSCILGEIYDVAIDVRPNSAHLGKYIGVKLSAEIGNQLWIPEGFLHGFCTLVPNCQIQYKVTNYYSASHERGVRYDDKDIAIDWPNDISNFTVSAKDGLLGTLKELEIS